MSMNNDNTIRAATLNGIPGVDTPYFFCSTCLARKWFDCDFRQRAENEWLGQYHPNFNPALVLPCSNCRFHGGKNCGCTPSPYTMRQTLQAMVEHPPHVVEEPGERQNVPMKNKNVSQYWQGSSNGTAPGLPQDVLQDPVHALQYPNRVSQPPATSQATMNQQLQALSLAPSSSSPRPQGPAPIVSSWYSHPPPAPAPAPAPAPPTFSFSLPIRGRDPEASLSEDAQEMLRRMSRWHG